VVTLCKAGKAQTSHYQQSTEALLYQLNIIYVHIIYFENAALAKCRNTFIYFSGICKTKN